MDVSSRLAVQSWCFRGFADNRAVARMVRELGLSKIELSGKHVKWAQPETFDDVIGAYRDAGVEIVSIGVNGMVGNTEVESGCFEFLRRSGAKYMSVDFAPDSFVASAAWAGKHADQLGAKLGIHNHGGRHWLGNSQTLSWVLSRCPASVGLCLDTAWAMHSQEDPAKMVEKFADRLYGLHFKDFVFERNGKAADTVIGTGGLDLDKLATALRAAKFNGYCVLEYEGDIDNPLPALAKCVTRLAEVDM